MSVLCTQKHARQELLGSNAHRQELLPAIWQAFLVLAEHCMKVSWCHNMK